MTADQLRDLLIKLRASETCHKRDLVDPITVLIATGLCRSELLALRWTDFDAEACLTTSVGAVVLVGVATATGAALGGCQSQNSRSAESFASSSANPNTGTLNPTAARQQVTLPIKGSADFYPQDVAVDAQSAVYGTAVNDGVLKLAPGAPAAVSVGFSGLQFAVSAGADAAGNVFVTDDGGTANGTGRVQKRTPTGTQTEPVCGSWARSAPGGDTRRDGVCG